MVSGEQDTEQGNATWGMNLRDKQETALMTLKLLPELFKEADRWLRVETLISKSSAFRWFMSQVKS